MKNKIKKNLWWIITSVVLFIPIAFAIHNLPYGLGDKLSFGVVTFALLFLIWAIIGLVADKIKRIVWKVLWIILGTLSYLITWLCAIFVIVMSYPLSEEDIEDRKDAFRDMVYREFDEDDHLDGVVGIELPQYKIADSECKYVSFPPGETEYDVRLKIYGSKGISKSVWDEIYELASTNASNPRPMGDVINKWRLDQDNPEIIHYTTEDSSNVGCNVTFKHRCDTVYVTRYKW